ncbi:tetratricopeptide repeat protein [Iningainema tapete]|uniref:tetratricopeptide repeat protein n=1 Tax=Iningainema tapete TaxID=2806730 RepID=UPI001EE2E454|nr:tetratricopeptide repeat protein [Iningainema tapete]
MFLGGSEKLRYNTFDLQPQVYSAVILRTLLAAVITFSIASFIDGVNPKLPSPKQDSVNTTPTPTAESPTPLKSQPEATPPPKQNSANGIPGAESTLPWQVLAFLIGIFPTRGVRWINFVTNRALNAPLDQYNEYPLKNIFGINTWHEARLSELGIDNVQSLATTDICKLLLSTQFDTQQIINWVDQAILYMKVGAKIERFREININTFHELQNALIDFGLHHGGNQEGANNSTDNQNNNCNQQKQKRPLSVLGFASLDEDEISILRDYSNYQNYNHIKAYYENAPEVARKQAASGKEFVINSLNRDFNILTITGGLAYPEAQDDVPIRRHISISLINQKEIEVEIKKLKEFLKENPENAKEYVYLGVAHYLLNQPYEAGKAYDKAISLEPKLAPAYSNRSVIYIQEKRYDDAIQDTRKAIHINPHFAEAFSNLGLAQLGLNDAFSAIESLTKALELNPRLEAAYCYRGIAYNTIAAGESQFLSAIEDFEIANLLGYESPVLWTTWGVALCSLGRYTEGIEKYDRAIAHSKVTSARLYARRGYANLQLGLAAYSEERIQQGANYYRRANHDFEKATVDKDNTSVSAFTNYGLLKSYEGDIKAREGRNEEASRLYEEAIQKYSKAINIYHQTTEAENHEEQREGGGLYVVHRNLAIVYQKLGKHSEAKTHYEKAIKLGDKTIQTYFNYGVSLHETKNLEQAREAFSIVANHSDSCTKLIEKAQVYLNKLNTEIGKS